MTKHEYIINILNAVEQKGTCLRAKVGAVFVNLDYEILSTGYNGAPRGLPSCEEEHKCLIHNNHCIRCAHAEANAITNAAKNGICIKNTIIYTTYSPCRNCANLLVNLGIKKLFYKKFKGEGLNVLKQAKIQFKKIMTF